ncbi:hypothetical protein CLU92_2367 [Janthinobacterium sp. 61]|uniref:hypothetical protein n=1 Tax=Janthinobacterium sp. 61 TaxID=2035209 RepID=UPI000CA889AC|nr:hypothetical protein [Janthinobacterium sp. 61]PKV45004.1 hypothetical protein CLU92_2367 [Janthinobacterium sp. 61]
MDSNQSSMAGTRGRLASLVFLCCLLACKVPGDKVWPRNQSLPLFNPHVADFICETESSKVPPIDAQAEDWFLEARAMEDPEIFVEDRDYKKIVALTRQAAERLHWKAMLNLASLYVEGRDPLYGEEEAVQLVERRCGWAYRRHMTGWGRITRMARVSTATSLALMPSGKRRRRWVTRKRWHFWRVN